MQSERTVRAATPEDLPALLHIYESARRFMRAYGNRSQWVCGYPSAELLASDIRRYSCFVLVSGGRIEGVFALLSGEEPTYARIEDGAWLSDASYLTIHRIAAAEGAHGVLQSAVCWSAKRCAHLRIDTHADNAPMLHLLPTLGFVRTGIIHLADGAPRIAFERLP